ncbi:MAG TPA: DUF1573 domain-containing protein [Chitinophagales bacterium]|nr:DUF1573 domain-containing protein [Chitinophagales bacterium]
MKNFIYALLAVAALYSCKNSQTSATTEQTGTEATATSPTASATDPNQQTANPVDPNNPNLDMPAEPQPGNAAFKFEKTEHDFGKIPQDKVVEYTFKFKNTGTEPLIISDARGSCGCTVPNYSKEPIAVGGTGEITVSFDPKGKTGVQRKTVTITANTNPARTTLNIVSEVEAPAGATPQ